ncbi:MAG: YbaB/EbfC family nucleoid-associated protein, partial [Verrucomicrobiota bacterium]
ASARRRNRRSPSTAGPPCTTHAPVGRSGAPAGGKVTVIANGAGEVMSLKIAKEIVDPEDVEFLEEAVLSGVKQAIEQGKALAQSEMTKITGGMGLTGLGL